MEDIGRDGTSYGNIGRARLTLGPAKRVNGHSWAAGAWVKPHTALRIEAYVATANFAADHAAVAHYLYFAAACADIGPAVRDNP